MMRFFPLPLRSGFTLAVRAALVLAAVSLFGACDRHSAEEVPENYGHGSNHHPDSENHQVDSSKKDHFSDTAGLKEEGGQHDDHHATPAPSVSNKGF